MNGPKVKNAQTKQFMFLQSLALVKPNYLLETPQKLISTRFLFLFQFLLGKDTEIKNKAVKI